LGQTPSRSPRPYVALPPTRAPYATAAASPFATTPGLGDVLEVQIRLAWLADPVTFPLNLRLNRTATGLRVTGFVPNPAVRRRVLEIAERQAGQRIDDGMKVMPGMALRMAGAGTASDLEEQARALLARVTPRQAAMVKISARVNGQVALSGSLPSLQDQL